MDEQATFELARGLSDFKSVYEKEIADLMKVQRGEINMIRDWSSFSVRKGCDPLDFLF